MLGGRDYSADDEFQKLCARSEDVDLTIAALELARDADPDLQFDATLAWIDKLASELSGPLARARSEADMLNELAAAIFGTHGITGNVAAYGRAESSFLPCIIESGRGIPISLSVLYMAVADRVGIDLMGVAAPAHYLTRYESADGPLFVDAFSCGRILHHDECLDWMRTLTKWPKQQLESSLRPATARTTIIRMLNNLKGVYAQREEWTAAWNVQHRLLALQPSSYAERRDLAVTAVRSHKSAEAFDLLNDCLKECEPSEQEFLHSQIALAQSQLARWN